MTEATDAPETEPATTAPGVRVPNVRPHAVSGLDHELLNPDAAAETEQPDEDTPEAEAPDDGPDPQPGADEDGFGGDAPDPEVVVGGDDDSVEGEKAADPDSPA